VLYQLTTKILPVVSDSQAVHETIKRVAKSPPDIRGDEYQVSIYIAVTAPSDQVRAHNRATFQSCGPTETTCIVVSGMMKEHEWLDPKATTKLQVQVRDVCKEFGEVLACVVPPMRTCSWTHQIFIAFKDSYASLKALKHFLKKGVGVVAEVWQ
jgi:hypothetical protein